MACEFIPTRGSLLKSKSQDAFKIVEFASYKSGTKDKSLSKSNEKVSVDKDVVEVNMKRARFEIIKLGTSGMQGKQKKDAKVQLAIKLGAKPPKNKYTNYKQLIENNKVQQDKEKSEMAFQQLGKNSQSMSTAKSKRFKRKKESSGLLDVYGKVKKSKLKM